MRIAVLAALLLTTLARAGELSVTYSVQDKPLMAGTPAGTPLTFTLYSDNACTQQVYQTTIPVENVTLISKLQLATLKGATKAPTTDQIQATLSGVRAVGNLYLTVVGTGVTASGSACQAQSAIGKGELTTVAGITISTAPCNINIGFGWCIQSPLPPNVGLADCGFPSPLLAYGRQAVAALRGLQTNVAYSCDLQTILVGGVVPRAGSSSFCPGGSVVYGIDNCTALAPTCNDGLKNQDETDVDCGGSQCPSCANGLHCLQNLDCQSNNCQGRVCQ